MERFYALLPANGSELVLFDAFVFDAILLFEGLVTSNDFEIRNHDQLATRIEQWRARGWEGSE